MESLHTRSDGWHALRRIEQSLLAAETGGVAELYLGVPIQSIGPHRP
ncbi:hypothetical protein [Streptomyces sp. NPDC051572]